MLWKQRYTKFSTGITSHSSLFKVRSDLVQASSILIVYGRHFKILLPTIFTSNTKRNEAKRFKVLSSLIPVFVMLHIPLIHSYPSVNTVYISNNEVPSTNKVLLYTECNS
jgi:hypothetical protein